MCVCDVCRECAKGANVKHEMCLAATRFIFESTELQQCGPGTDWDTFALV